MATNSSKSPLEKSKSRLGGLFPSIVIDNWEVGLACVVMLIWIVGGLVVVWFQPLTFRGTALLWALACCVAGSLPGFLFSIPHSSSGAATPQSPNTNLDQLSDWLTKVLLGAGLVQLKTLPGQIARAGAYIANGLGPDQHYSQFAAALVVYFTVLGFFSGYLGTRVLYDKVFGPKPPETEVKAGAREGTDASRDSEAI
jgi:hypothetical protein